MIEDLKIYQWLPQTPILPIPGQQFFVLKTCQRVLYLGFQKMPSSAVYSDHRYFEGHKAYSHLLEIICGLQSKLIGEYEIVSQFKKAYQEYALATESPNPLILKFLEKLFKDAKKIRTQHLTSLGVQTYAGIARQVIKQNRAEPKVLVLGSGQLAESFIRISKKLDITIAARNTAAVSKLTQQFSIGTADYNQPDSLLEFPIIYNTLGPEAEIWQNGFLEDWLQQKHPQRLLIDLSKPTMLTSKYINATGMMTLEDIFSFGEQMGLEKSNQIEKAKREIQSCVSKRALDSSSSFPFGWEELSFA